MSASTLSKTPALSHFAFQVMDDDPVRQMTDFAEKVMAKY